MAAVNQGLAFAQNQCAVYWVFTVFENVVNMQEFF